MILLCIILGACAALVWRKYTQWSRHPLPPALAGALPIIGHTSLIIGDSASLWYTLNNMSKECMKKGGVVTADIGMDLYYLITDADDALTAANACTQKHFSCKYAKTWLGDGLLTSSGALWQRHRKLLNPAFSVPLMHGFLDVFNHMSKELVNEVRPHAGKQPFNHYKYISVVAFQTFSSTSFGISDNEVKDFAKKYMKSAHQAMTLIVYRFTHFWMHSDFIYKLSGLKEKIDNLIDTLNDMAYEFMVALQVINRKKEDMKTISENKKGYEFTTYGSRSKPLINLLLELKNEDSLSDKEIREEVDTAMLSGFETTSHFLTYLMIILGSYPKVQERMYEEIMEVLGADRDVEKDDLKRLVYTEAVIKECLRILPVTPALLRCVDKDVKLKNCTMRAGSQCVLLILGIHRDPRYGEDVDDFRPERWLDPAISSLSNSAFYGFSLGKRSCIGKTYAMVSMKVTLSHFVRRYKITADIKQTKFKVDMVLKPLSPTISIENRN